MIDNFKILSEVNNKKITAWSHSQISANAAHPPPPPLAYTTEVYGHHAENFSDPHPPHTLDAPKTPYQTNYLNHIFL